MDDSTLLLVVIVAFFIGYGIVSFVIGRIQKRSEDEKKMMPPPPPDDPWSGSR